DPVDVTGGPADLTYMITVTNGGQSDSQFGANLFDNTPANTTFKSFDIISYKASGGADLPLTDWTPVGTNEFSNVNNIPAHSQAIFKLVVTVGANVPDQTKISNTATVQGAQDD